MSWRSILLALAGTLCAFTSRADLESAANDRARGQYAAAIAEYQRLAEAGDPVAQVNLGYMYYMGEGMPRNYGQALAWYTEAAAQGNADAQYNLAVAYAFGEGTAQDLETAVKWYRAAADQGHAVAQYSLGLSLSNGEGVPADPEQAVLWYTRAAEQGYIPARIMLGSKYYTGDDVPLDYEAAARWYRLAAEQGNAMAQYNLAGLYRAGRGVEQNETEARAWYTKSATQGYSPAAAALTATGPGAKEALDAGASPPVNATTHATAGTAAVPAVRSDSVVRETSSSTPALTAGLVEKQLARLDKHAPVISSMPVTGASGLMGMDAISPSLPAGAASELLDTSTKIVAVSADEATTSPGKDRKISADAAINDNTGESPAGMPDRLAAAPVSDTETIAAGVSPDILDGTYEKGLNELKNKNFGIAHDLFNTAATNGYAPAQYQLALLYQRGPETRRDNEAAASWYRRAAEQGMADAQFNLANMYLMGEGLIQNDAQARYWYERAAAQGHAEASHNLQNLSRLNPVSLEQASLLSAGLQSPVADPSPADTGHVRASPQMTDAGNSTLPATAAATMPPDANADYERALAYAFGSEVPKDLRSAFIYFRKAAQHNHVQAQYKLAVAYAYGEGTGRDMTQALYWYERAAMQGHPIARRNLGLIYLNGDGGSRNKPLALAWFSILADRGNAIDIQRMESLRGELTPEEIAQAEQLKQKLIETMTKQTAVEGEP